MKVSNHMTPRPLICQISVRVNKFRVSWCLSPTRALIDHLRIEFFEFCSQLVIPSLLGFLYYLPEARCYHVIYIGLDFTLPN